jgi:UDP-N-acetylmuramoyl-L-alanyl-D-glutamate--2,6-diaminopimelate ligase
MKKLIKKVLCYDKIYPIVKDSSLYHFYKKSQWSIANSLYNNPSDNFFIIGVTWTNGKTTTVNLLQKILNDNVAPTISISTADIRIDTQRKENSKKMTSLNVYDLQSYLTTAKDSWCRIAVLEASSQWLDQHRFEGIDFDVAVLTNITHDHLDYHWDMEKYANAKKILFKNVLSNKKQTKIWVFPTDDTYGRKWFEEMPLDKKISYSSSASSILKATQIIEYLDHTEFVFSYLGKLYRVKTNLLWAYNVNNILAAIWVGIEIGLDMSKIIASVESFQWVNWRLQKQVIKWATYFVDFAHTPDALEKTLTFLEKEKGDGRLITVFWVPWNRDTEKRPIMWELAWKFSDIAICTDDDPDTENRLSILNELSKPIQERFLAPWKLSYIIPERHYAIKFATEIAKPGDIILLAGKWHEKVQLTNYWKRNWSDYAELEAIKKNSN